MDLQWFAAEDEGKTEEASDRNSVKPEKKAALQKARN